MKSNIEKICISSYPNLWGFFLWPPLQLLTETVSLICIMRNHVWEKLSLWDGRRTCWETASHEHTQTWCRELMFLSLSLLQGMKKRLWVEIWIPYFQILLWSCEANFVYDNFSGCFSCRITDEKITKAGREILLSPEQIQHPSWFLLPENAQIAPEGAQNIELNSRQVPKDSLDSTHKRSGKPHTQKGKCPHVQLTNIQTAEWCG